MQNSNRIKAFHVEKGKMDKWFSDKLGNTLCIDSQWCSNRIQPDLNTIDKIDAFLKVDKRSLIEPLGL